MSGVDDEDGDSQRACSVRGREPTMADVADRLGVSRQLVSLVLRGEPGPSARTRERVLKAAAELGYQPHLGAQVLRQSRSRQIGVGFVPSNFTEPDIVDAMYEVANEAGYAIVLSAQTPHRSTGQVLGELQSYRCAGLITISSTLAHEELTRIARRSPVPITLVGYGSQNPDYDVIHSAGDIGIAQCVDHLVELGHRDIAYVDVTSVRPAPLRREGYLAACSRRGLTPLVVTSDEAFAEEGGATAAHRLLDGESLPTAVACVNDQAAFGAAMVLLKAGVRLPKDVSITGFDDSRLAAWSFLDLTSARQDPTAMGTVAVAALLRRVVDRGLPPEEVVVQPSLVIRSSTAQPRSMT